ncbi:nucleotidyltransferase family protein [Streptococcus saliviloxodontae]|nr:nucleotidyltransferase family protein [Streptococcus saliviloxodontae]
MALFEIVAGLGLSDCWIAAGTLRNYIWNVLSARSGLDDASDIDVVFYDPELPDEERKALESALNQTYPNYQWELKNQVNMHYHSPHTKPYQSSRDAISKYPETCTAIAGRLDERGSLELFLPYGVEDIVSFTVKPTPHFATDAERMAVYRSRLAKKSWASKWQRLKIIL